MHMSTASHIPVYQGCHALRLDAAMDPHHTQVTPNDTHPLVSLPSSYIQPLYYPKKAKCLQARNSFLCKTTYLCLTPHLDAGITESGESASREESFPASQMHVPLPLRHAMPLHPCHLGNRVGLNIQAVSPLLSLEITDKLMSLYLCEEGNERGTSTSVASLVSVRRLLVVRLSTLSHCL